MMGKRKSSYHDMLRQDLSQLVDDLELPELYQRSMKARWLDQLLWTDKKAAQAQKRFYFFRLTTVIGGVIIPALVAFNHVSPRDGETRGLNGFLLFSLTQVVAVCTAVEEFCQYGARWRQYRATAENLKSEGWQFFQLSGTYRKAGSHLQAYPVFSTRVERLIRRDVQAYLSEVIKDQKQEDEENSENSSDVEISQLSALHSGFFSGVSADTSTSIKEPISPTTFAQQYESQPSEFLASSIQSLMPPVESENSDDSSESTPK
ncbi:MAG: DUF4231 domain-containing protein [Cyanobacteria bacterium J06638_28]